MYGNAEKISKLFQCTKTCGGGIQRRSARCVDDNLVTLDDGNCEASSKVTQQVCNMHNCPVWSFGEWTPVSIKQLCNNPVNITNNVTFTLFMLPFCTYSTIFNSFKIIFNYIMLIIVIQFVTNFYAIHVA